MTPVRVLGLHGVGQGAVAALVVGTLDGARVLGFHIPRGEALRVARVLGLARCRRVPIYDLVGGVTQSLGGRVAGAILDAQPDGICARLRVARLDGPGGDVEIACHPADAVAVALQASAPILATAAALDRSTPIDVDGEGEASVASWLERVRPEDFGSPAGDAARGR